MADGLHTIPADPIDLIFTGAHHRALAEALERAFPSYQDLSMMVQYTMGLNLQSISSSFNKLGYVAFELIRHQQAAGHVIRLIAAARSSQPDNPQLALLAEQFGLAIPTPRAELEKIVKKTSVPFDVAVWRERLAKRENCVCRIEVPTNAGMTYGSGFLVGRDLVLTNHHVVSAAIAGKEGGYTSAGATADPRAIVARFDYKALDDGTKLSEGREARLAADWLVDASPHSPVDLQGLPKQGVPSGDELDSALIRLAEPIGDLPIYGGQDSSPIAKPRGCIEMPAAAWPFSAHKSLFIIQHPSGTPMKLALDLDAAMEVNANGTRVIYQTGTEAGSSGSPCFNQFWNLVALHHAGDPSHEGFYHPTFNEGIPINRIVERLTSKGLTAGLRIT